MHGSLSPGTERSSPWTQQVTPASPRTGRFQDGDEYLPFPSIGIEVLEEHSGGPRSGGMVKIK